MDLKEAIARSKEALPVIQGQVRVEGCDGEVTITRDERGIPYVEAGSAMDAIFGSGYVLGQDRLWQLDLYRRIAFGRTAEILGPMLVGLDTNYRRLLIGRSAEREWEQQTGEARAALEAYAAGVNAAMATNPLPVEFQIIGYAPEPWRPADSLAIHKMATLGSVHSQKLLYTHLAARHGPDLLREMMPQLPLETTVGGESCEDLEVLLQGLDASLLEMAQATPADGSNNWAVSGERSKSGKPIVAGDPHLAISIPAQWYQIRLGCPEFQVAGVYNPGYPGFMYYGFNGHVTWTVTTSLSDRHELCLERLRKNGNGWEHQTPEGWELCETRTEEIAVRGGEPRAVEVVSTRNGPLLERRDGWGISLRWQGHEVTHDFACILPMMRAMNVAEFRVALSGLRSNHSNMIFADSEGSIAYQMTGAVPRRPKGGRIVPVPGWSGKDEWQGTIPFEELPALTNPPDGWIATANNRIAGPDYPHYLAFYGARHRVERVRELLRSAEQFGVDDFKRFQLDQTSTALRTFGEALKRAVSPFGPGRAARPLHEGNGSAEDQAWTQLAAFRGDMRPESAGAAIVATARDILAEELFGRRLREVTTADLWILPRSMFHGYFESGRSALLEGYAEDWPAALRKAYEQALRVLAEQHGADPAGWSWGGVQQMRFRHNLGRVPPWGELFNLSTLPVGGDFSTVFCVNAGDNSTQSDNGTSFRIIVDMARPREAWTVLPPGQSGHPASPHYGDGREDWLRGGYALLELDLPESGDVLRLLPREGG